MPFIRKLLNNLKRTYKERIMENKDTSKTEFICEAEEDSLAQETLMNDLIIDEILSNLSFEDIKRCRLVCGKWYDASWKFVEKKGALTLPMYQFSGSNAINEIMASGNELPCSRVRVIDPPLKKRSIFDNFIVKYGNEIKELEFETVVISRKEFNYFQDILFKKMPFLESLSFGAIQVREEEESSSELETVPSVFQLKFLKRIQFVQRSSVANSALMNNFLRKILECSPNLTEVKANNPIFLKNLLEKLPERSIANIKHISYVYDQRSRVVAPYLKDLSDKGLKLKSFEWEDTRGTPDFEDLIELLDIQKCFLKSFSLDITQYNFHNPDLPSMPKLPLMKTLETLNISSVSPMYFQQEDWLAQFPALKKFNYSSLTKSPLQELLKLLSFGECAPHKQLTFIRISSNYGLDITALKLGSYLFYKSCPGLKTFVYKFRSKEISFSSQDLQRYLPK